MGRQAPQGARSALQAPLGARHARGGRRLAYDSRAGRPEGVDEGSKERSGREDSVLRGEASLRWCGVALDGDRGIRQRGSVCGSCGFNLLRGSQGQVVFHGRRGS
ncbi:hypothetical protein V8G54_020933 [Vigna mungo]|uniref:Uncharacterized protein n=1 Tax=Vigna mungo TaxID=3915 RepID=A0AAQ3NDD9_VIGMU